MKKIRIGMMGLGHIGRQLFHLILKNQLFDLVAVADIGQPEILHNLLVKSMGDDNDIRLENNYLVSEQGRTRLMPTDHPGEIPWDVFAVDLVIDATGRFRTAHELTPHLENGAKRVILSTLPDDEIDRVICYGVNESSACIEDSIISAGSASTSATALALKVITEARKIEHATMTSVHAYTSDQSLRDYAGSDYRRSRSGAENIIPNETPALHWVQRVLPVVKGKFSAYALNVPVQIGSMLDLTVALSDPADDVEFFNNLFIAAAAAHPRLIETTNDPIVSSDVKGCTSSLLVDLQGTMKAGKRMVKLLFWHESLAHAFRILDLAQVYADLDAAEEKTS